jgi:hypothetical protein
MEHAGGRSHRRTAEANRGTSTERQPVFSMKELLHLLQDCMVGIFPSGSIVHTFLRSGTVQPRVSFPGKNLLFHWSFLQKLSITAVSAYTLV